MDNPAEVALVEALLFAHGEPLSIEDIARVSKLDQSIVETALNVIKEKFQEESHGIELQQVAKKYQLRTKTVFAPFIRELKTELPRRLSNPALETLAVIAYRQPVVKSDIEKIRGVDVTPTLKTLIDRGLIKIMGHQASVGQPALYGTTDEFLSVFGLNSLSELPSLRDLTELEQDPGEEPQVLLASSAETEDRMLSASSSGDEDRIEEEQPIAQNQ